ncbi:MAG: hypothetical protein QM820_61030 [Minicystis sp.]
MYAAKQLVASATDGFLGAAALVALPLALLGRSQYRSMKREADAAVTWKA